MFLDGLRHQQGPEPNDLQMKKIEANLFPTTVESIPTSPAWSELAPSDQGVEGAVALTADATVVGAG